MENSSNDYHGMDSEVSFEDWVKREILELGYNVDFCGWAKDDFKGMDVKNNDRMYGRDLDMFKDSNVKQAH